MKGKPRGPGKGRFNLKTRWIRLPALVGLLTLLGACTIDGGGFFISKSTPDERFAASRALPDPLWTLPPPPAAFSFVFITDSHVYQRNTSRLAKLNAALTTDRFLVHGGDITQDGHAEDIQAYLDWTKTLPIPAYTALGNHDLYFDGWDHVGPALGQSSFSLAVGPDLRIIILDTGNATLGAAQLQWLQGVLAAAKESTIVAVSHHPLFSTGFSSFNLSDNEEGSALVQLFSHYGVKLVLSGHTHAKSWRTIGPTLYLIGEASRAEDSGQDAVRITVNRGAVSYAFFPLP